MPPLLGALLEIRATEMNRMGVRLCNERGAIAAARCRSPNPEAGFGCDGFHASEAGCRGWAEHLVDFVPGN